MRGYPYRLGIGYKAYWAYLLPIGPIIITQQHMGLHAYSPRICKEFSLYSNPVYALHASRTCPSTFENMPFLTLEDALLDTN